MRALEELQFDNTYARLPEVFHRRLLPTPFAEPAYLVNFNEDAAKLIDLEMLLLPGGRERTEREFRDLLSGAGFTLTRIVPTKSPLSVIEAK